MVKERPHLPWLHEVDTVKVGHIHRLFVGEGIVISMLVNIQRKKNHVNTINVLKDNNAFTTVGKLLRIVLMSISLPHLIANFQLSVSGRHLPNGQRPPSRKISIRLFKGNVL